MSDKEVLARVKIDKLLTDNGWRLIDEGSKKKNVVLEQGYRNNKKTMFTDYLLLDDYNRPLAVIEAKKESYPLRSAKAQALEYATALHVKYFYLSNGEQHYFCCVDDGVLHDVASFKSQKELISLCNNSLDRKDLWEDHCESTVLAEIKIPGVKTDSRFLNEKQRDDFVKESKIKILRDYQKEAVNAIIESAQKGNSRFLLEMATGTGKTLTCAAIIEIFLRTKNAHRVLFLVDRIELENQARDSLNGVFDNGQHYIVNVYKEGRDNWRAAQIMITTVQSLLVNDRYKTEFLPSDFDLLIVDEAHRTIGGRARDVFEYFIGFKIGLTATPKDYFRGVNTRQLIETDIYEYDARAFNDTYITFGCASGKPTFEFPLSEGVKTGVLVQPYAIDARTDITYELLDNGLKVNSTISSDLSEDEKNETLFDIHDFEKSLFSESTNEMFCRMFLENAKRDPITSEIGKTIIFCVTQAHAGKIANELNRLIKEYEPDKWMRYGGNFAAQVSSSVPDHASMSKKFTHDLNELNGTSAYSDEYDVDNYKTTKTRVCCTVSMMTTGYDCQDLMNICLMRPVLQPSEFIQIKGRGTRIFNFAVKGKNVRKDEFFFFDYFGNFERFEGYNYDKKLKAPSQHKDISQPSGVGKDPSAIPDDGINLTVHDGAAMLVGAKVGDDGMRIDREFNKGTTIRDVMLHDEELKAAVEQGDWKRVIEIVNAKYNNKPQFGYVNNATIGNELRLQRVPSWEELVQLYYGIKSHLKTKEELLQESVQKCMEIFEVDELKKKDVRKLIEAYVESKEIRSYIEGEKYMMFDYTGIYSVEEFMKLGDKAVVIARNLKNYIQEELLRCA